MFPFLIGWGVFWLLIWLFIMILGLMPPQKVNDTNLIGAGFLGLVVSIAYLTACLVGRMLAG